MPAHDADRQSSADPPESGTNASRSAYRWRGRVGLFLGPLLMLAFLLFPPPEGIGREAWWVLA